MITRQISEQLARHPRTHMFWNPVRQLRRLRDVGVGEFDTWVGERPDGKLELIRVGRGEAAVELLLNEAAVAEATADVAGVVDLLWTARTGAEELTLAYAWSEDHELAYPLDLRWLLRSFIALAKTVGGLHKAGYLHGDLKPEAIHWAEDPAQLQLWDLRMAQQPGERRFDAFSARFAAPEQVAGGALGFDADVYALGVMLYSLFIRDRFPSIILPKGGAIGAPARKGAVQQAALSPITAIGAFEHEEAGIDDVFYAPNEQMQMNAPPIQAKMRALPAPPAARSDNQTILGAKILFAMELERVVRRTADIGVAKELLAVIETATAQKPAERFEDGDAFAAEVAKLLTLAEELAG